MKSNEVEKLNALWSLHKQKAARTAKPVDKISLGTQATTEFNFTAVDALNRQWDEYLKQKAEHEQSTAQQRTGQPIEQTQPEQLSVNVHPQCVKPKSENLPPTDKPTKWQEVEHNIGEMAKQLASLEAKIAHLPLESEDSSKADKQSAESTETNNALANGTVTSIVPDNTPNPFSSFDELEASLFLPPNPAAKSINDEY